VYSFANLIRLVMVLLLAAHAFFMYGQARTLAETCGFDAGVALASATFAMVLMIPFTWTYGLADLPEIWTKHFRPRRRWRRGECADCGYPRTGAPATSERCAECGAIIAEPPPYAFGWPTIRRFLIMVAMSLAMGCAAAETMLLLDEHAFRVEAPAKAANSVTGRWTRPRSWPHADAALVYDAAANVYAATD